MTIQTNNNGAPTQKKQKRIFTPAFFQSTCLAIVITGLLASCSRPHFDQDNFDSGLLEFGQNWSHYNCQKQRNTRSYQECKSRVDETYDAYKK